MQVSFRPPPGAAALRPLPGVARPASGPQARAAFPSLPAGPAAHSGRERPAVTPGPSAPLRLGPRCLRSRAGVGGGPRPLSAPLRKRSGRGPGSPAACCLFRCPALRPSLPPSASASGQGRSLVRQCPDRVLQRWASTPVRRCLPSKRKRETLWLLQVDCAFLFSARRPDTVEGPAHPRQ